MSQLFCMVFLVVWVVFSVLIHRWTEEGEQVNFPWIVGCIVGGLFLGAGVMLVTGLFVLLVMGALGQ